MIFSDADGGVNSFDTNHQFDINQDETKNIFIERMRHKSSEILWSSHSILEYDLNQIEKKNVWRSQKRDESSHEQRKRKFDAHDNFGTGLHEITMK